MKTLNLRFALTALFAFSLVNAPAAAPQDKHESGWVFSFLPKSLQGRPLLDMTVFTEMTDAGRLVVPASPDHPVYYVVQPGGYRQLGGSIANEHSPRVTDLERVMKKALASSGYLPVTDSSQRPSLLIVFNWGSHNRLDPQFAAISPQAALKNLLERAILVGGRDFAAKVGHAYEQRALTQLSGPSFSDVSFSFVDPVRRLTDWDAKMEYLMYQINYDLYFVVASAYDYASVAQDKRMLLWRTKMTVNTQGVSMTETLSPLIATAAPFFGQETTAPEALSRRINRRGQVDIGKATVVGYEEPAVPPAPPASKSGTSKP